MTPQQLIDMPGYGMAEAWLRRNGRWRLDPQERLANALSGLDNAISEAEEYAHDALNAARAMEANE